MALKKLSLQFKVYFNFFSFIFNAYLTSFYIHFPIITITSTRLFPPCAISFHSSSTTLRFPLPSLSENSMPALRSPVQRIHSSELQDAISSETLNGDDDDAKADRTTILPNALLADDGSAIQWENELFYTNQY